MGFSSATDRERERERRRDREKMLNRIEDAAFDAGILAASACECDGDCDCS